MNIIHRITKMIVVVCITCRPRASVRAAMTLPSADSDSQPMDIITLDITMDKIQIKIVTCRPRASVRAAMTLPRADSDWLIFLLSSSRRPVAPVSRTRSDPARSTRFSLPTCVFVFVFVFVSARGCV